MGDKSSIEWTRGDDGSPGATWNPVVGCTRVSPGCDHCYAFQLHDQRHVAWKRGRMPSAAPQYHEPFSRVQLLPTRLDQPLRWQKPRRIFVNSLSDLFHDAVPDEYIAQVFAVMAAAKQHTFQVLTKRPERMRSLLDSDAFVDRIDTVLGVLSEDRGWCLDEIEAWPLPNVWLGVSAEDQERADERIPLLVQTPAAVRFLSCEPLLGPINLGLIGTVPAAWSKSYSPVSDHLHWVIGGGESGPHARPCHPDWARALRDECTDARVAFFWKQWGEWAPYPAALANGAKPPDDGPGKGWVVGFVSANGGVPDPLTGERGAALVRCGKHAAGRILDGRTWDEFPKVAEPVPV